MGGATEHHAKWWNAIAVTGREGSVLRQTTSRTMIVLLARELNEQTYGRPGAAMPIGVAVPTENFAGVVGVRLPFVPILKPATSFVPLFAT